jgi:L-aspartate oxidase
MPLDFDVIVVGSGIAGLSLALKAADAGRRTAILTKKTRAESNTNYAQGGIACVTSDSDDFESHVRDTLVAGDGLCREEVVRSIVRDGPARIHELIERGLKFSRDASGGYALGREGGHYRARDRGCPAAGGGGEPADRIDGAFLCRRSDHHGKVRA